MRLLFLTLFAFAVGLAVVGVLRVGFRSDTSPLPPHLQQSAGTPVPHHAPAGMEVAIFGNGCFWCTEAVFKQMKGVSSVTSGYTGGATENPTYQAVCTGLTGHAEAIRVVYDPKKITYKELLEVFFVSHDPTTLNRQGHDTGTQYRSAIFYVNDEQKRLAEKAKTALDESGAYRDPIVTEIAPAAKFYPAEKSHHDYYASHEGDFYCQRVIAPKVAKVREVFRDKVK